MLRIGKKEDEHEQADKQEAAAYSTPRTYTPANPVAETPAKPSLEPASSARAVTESESIARDFKEGTLSGYVGSGTVVTGEATFKAMLRIDGQMSGRVTSSSGTLIIGTNGRVDANIDVAVAMIHGTVNGDIIATQRLELGRAAKVNGNIQSPSLVIEQGAIFEGSCKMVQGAAVDKAKKPFKAEDQVLDTTRIKTVSANSKATEIASISNVAS
jgi:cytoskeletal protein CcmA (bactofilin family)